MIACRVIVGALSFFFYSYLCTLWQCPETMAFLAKNIPEAVRVVVPDYESDILSIASDL